MLKRDYTNCNLKETMKTVKQIQEEMFKDNRIWILVKRTKGKYRPLEWFKKLLKQGGSDGECEVEVL